MSKRRREGGLTLIEILLALLVMVLGVLGILALFPQALQSSSESVSETYAAILSESVAHAFKTAVLLGKYDVAASEWTCVMAHDLKSSLGSATRFTFTLPKLDSNPGLGAGWMHYPSGGAIDKGEPYIPSSDPEASGSNIFNLGGDGWTYATVQKVMTANDRSLDPWCQYGFDFLVKKINTLEYLTLPPPQINPGTGVAYTQKDLEPLTKLYEIRVRIFRVATQVNSGGGGTGTGSTSTKKKLISETSYRVGTK